jgi:hypothetical protein
MSNTGGVLYTGHGSIWCGVQDAEDDGVQEHKAFVIILTSIVIGSP